MIKYNQYKFKGIVNIEVMYRISNVFDIMYVAFNQDKLILFRELKVE